MNRQEWSKRAMEESVAIILVGGRSRRMNYQDKMHLKIGEESFLEIAMRKLSFFREITISASQTQVEKLDISNLQTVVDKSVHVVGDKFYDVGPMGGMYSVMSEIQAEYFFVVSCDMPYIEREIIEELYSHLEKGDDALVAVAAGKIQPLFAIYHSSMHDKILSQIERQEYRILDVYDKINIRYVSLEVGDTLENINTPEDLKKISKIRD